MKKTTKKAPISLPINTAAIKKTIRKINFLPIIALLVVIAVVYAYYRFGIVATVNGKPISRLAYISTLEKQDKKQTIQQMANEALVYQEAAKKSITIDQSVIDAQVASVEAQITAQGQTLDAALTAEGMTKADLEKQIRLQKIVEKLANANVNITQAEIDKYVLDNKASLPTTYTKDQLQTLAREQLTTQAENTAIDTWFSELQKNSQIVIR